MLARTTLRRPFVVTVAAAAAAAASAATFACGGQIAEFGDEGTDTSATTPITPTPTTPTGDGGTPRPEGCPEARPEHGGACATAQRCTYGDCGGSPTGEATCVDGRWESYEVSCNPPPPICPDARPVDGTPCFVSEASTCGYDDCSGTPATQARCVDGTWQVQRMSCNPPPPLPCPQAPPQFGAACSNEPTQTCSYGSCAQGSPATLTATCTNGKWTGTALSCIDAGLPPPPPPPPN